MVDNAENEAYINYLIGLKKKDDRGALANLRRGLGKPPGTVAKMHKYVVPWIIPKTRASDYYLIGALFASHPEQANGMDMGKVFKRVWQTSGKTDSIEKRFMALMDCDLEELPNHLRHGISLAKSKDVSIDWFRLIEDIRNWDHDDKWVQKKWATSFWGYERKDE